jgi:hypothetical protein
MYFNNFEHTFPIIIYLIDREKKGGAVHIFSIFYTHHRVPNEHMMTINFDTITNNYMKLFM